MSPKRHKIIYLVKGSRFNDAHPRLSPNISMLNASKGLETCLLLDLNVIVDMEDVASGKSTLEETGLDRAVSILNGTPGLVLVPGFGFHEVSTRYLASRISGYNAFLEKYCPTYLDTTNSVMSTLDRRLSVKTVYSRFGDMPDEDKFLIAPFYANMLKVRILTLNSTRRPIEKFFDLLRFQCEELDYLTVVPLELAKYTFCAIPDINYPEFREFCAKMRSIVVKKRPRYSDNLLKDCLNAAYDVFYYLMSCASPALTVDGRKQDQWILTGDEGLASMADAVYFDAAYPLYLLHVMVRVIIVRSMCTFVSVIGW